ncbi:hypothetical protein FRC12_004817 [Ceratobasidium sp. 428]|nr:hypothetical protein FRC12_004817 [Ceratobasidium sp. 428]
MQKTQLDSISPTQPAAGITTSAEATAWDEKVFVTPPEDIDDFGAELGQNAQFWRTYVGETNGSDTELVDGWNKWVANKLPGMNILILKAHSIADLLRSYPAALFSSVLTPHVLQSSKLLQVDHTKVSAQHLDRISQTLIVLTTGGQLDISTLPARPEAEPNPASAAIWINTLWYLALCLSIAVALFAFLAKDWCYSFMSDRTGHPCTQGRRRQERWNGLTRWKLRPFLAFLPWLIHLALVMYSIGLGLYLWNYVHVLVAVPALCILFTAGILYLVFTILPMHYEFCPYSTTFTRIWQSLCQKNKQSHVNSSNQQNPEQDMITSQAIHWIITSCKIPESVDIALQAIAGATSSLPRDPLVECGAETLICQRLTSQSCYSRNSGATISLFTRALSFLRQNTPDRHSSNVSSSQGILEVRLWEMQSKSEQYAVSSYRKNTGRTLIWKPIREVITHLGGDILFIPTQENLKALEIGSTAASSCLRMLIQKQSENLLVVETAVNLLSRYLHNQASLHPASLLALTNATRLFFSCGTVHYDTGIVLQPLIRLVKAHSDTEVSIYQRLYEPIAIILASFALSRYNSRHATRASLPTPSERIEWALEMTNRYNPLTSPPNLQTAHYSTLMHFGLLGLVQNLEPFPPSDDSCKALAQAFDRITPPPVRYTIHTPPENSQRLNCIFKSVFPQSLSRIWQAVKNDLVGESLVDAYLNAIKTSAADFTTLRQLPSEIYMFVVESTCRAQSSNTISACLTLMGRFPFPPVLSDDLIRIITRENIVELLLWSQGSAEQNVASFARSQLWVLFALLGQALGQFTEEQQRFYDSLNNYAILLDLGGPDPHRLQSSMSSEFEDNGGRDELENADTAIYFARVYEWMLLERGYSWDANLGHVQEILDGRQLPGGLRASPLE